jgi:hypothetical protein
MDRATDEYLTINELAMRLKLKPKTIKNKMASGAFRQGVHYFRPQGMQARFKWSAVTAWLEQTQASVTENNGDLIPMPRSYRVRDASAKKVNIAS